MNLLRTSAVREPAPAWYTWNESENPEQTQRALQHVQEAINGLPASFTKDYHVAMAIAPEIMHREVLAIRFLRCCHGDPWQAAARLCQHLTYRRTVYGEADWLKPLRLHDGALTPQDIAVLRSGVVALLTPPPGAADQRQVLVVNFPRARGVDYYAHNSRIFFYLCNTTINEYSQTHGVNVLLVLDSSGIKINPGNGRLFQVTHTSCAFTLHQVILANDPHDTKVTLAHLCGMTMRRLAEKFWGGSKGKLTNVAEASPEATLQRLVSMGLHPSTIPSQLGGSFTYERHFKEWLAMRLVQEQAQWQEQRQWPPRDLALPSPTASMPHSEWQPNAMDTKVQAPSLPTSGAAAAATPATMSRVKKETPKPAPHRVEIRKRNCEYSKKHYYKKKHQIQTLEMECESLRHTQWQLQATQAYLEDLWRQAREVVDREVHGRGTPATSNFDPWHQRNA